MPRIRSIKPDFWTDEKLVEISLAARLLFIGLWNFADDYGNIPYSIKRIKMQVLPSENIDCEKLIQELISIGTLREYSVNNDKYLNITHFRKHQVINKPSKTAYPKPDFSSTTVVVVDGRGIGSGKGRGIGEEERKKDPPIYFFEGRKIKLTEKDYNAWKKNYPNLNLDSELQKLDDFYFDEKVEKWFVRASAALAKKNQELPPKKPEVPKMKAGVDYMKLMREGRSLTQIYAETGKN